MMFDVIIVGGGPAGLSAALMLGRARRRVLICDTDQPRNAVSPAVHGFLSRDGTAPEDLRRIGREQLRPYETVISRSVEVIDAARDGDDFAVTLDGDSHERAHFLLLATGMIDEPPAISGVQELWGTSVLQCPYCHGWEVRDQPLAIFGQGDDGLYGVLLLLGWSQDLVLCTNGPSRLSGRDRRLLSSQSIPVREERIERVEGEPGGPVRIMFERGDALMRRAIFLHAAQRQHSPLAERLGCTFTDRGTILTDEDGYTGIPGLYAAGDLRQQSQQAIFAAADGALAAIAINTELLGLA
jgi:thioredoxin reductase